MKEERSTWAGSHSGEPPCLLGGLLGEAGVAWTLIAGSVCMLTCLAIRVEGDQC